MAGSCHGGISACLQQSDLAAQNARISELVSAANGALSGPERDSLDAVVKVTAGGVTLNDVIKIAESSLIGQRALATRRGSHRHPRRETNKIQIPFPGRASSCPGKHFAAAVRRTRNRPVPSRSLHLDVWGSGFWFGGFCWARGSPVAL